MSSRGGRSGGYRPGGGQPNMQQLMKQLTAAQDRIAATELNGTAGGGLVAVTMLGTGEVTSLTIAAAAVDPDDVESLQDLVVAALRDARRQLEALTSSTMGPLAGGAGLSGLGLPGL